MLPVLLAGVGAAIAGVKGLTPKVDMYANGAGDIDGGTLFVAGEMGKTETVEMHYGFVFAIVVGIPPRARRI